MASLEASENASALNRASLKSVSEGNDFLDFPDLRLGIIKNFLGYKFTSFYAILETGCPKKSKTLVSNQHQQRDQAKDHHQNVEVHLSGMH